MRVPQSLRKGANHLLQLGNRLFPSSDALMSAPNLEKQFHIPRRAWPCGTETQVDSSCRICKNRKLANSMMGLKELVGERGFEPPTPWSRIQ